MSEKEREEGRENCEEMSESRREDISENFNGILLQILFCGVFEAERAGTASALPFISAEVDLYAFHHSRSTGFLRFCDFY